MTILHRLQRLVFLIVIAFAYGCNARPRDSQADRPIHPSPEPADVSQSNDAEETMASTSTPPSGDTVTIEIGMEMSTARRLLAKRGRRTEIAFSVDHDAYLLHDDLVVVITGGESLESILAIHGFSRGKAHRDYEEVERFTY